MRTSPLRSMAIFAVVLLVAVWGAGAVDAKSASLLVSWDAVAREFKRAASFSAGGTTSGAKEIPIFARAVGSGKGARGFSVRPGDPVVFPLPPTVRVDAGKGGRVALGLAAWTGSSWRQTEEVSGRLYPDQVRIDKGIGREGFFRLQFVLQSRGEGITERVEIFVISVGNWKRDLLAHCRLQREQIEMHPDPELIRSSLAVGYWDRLMETVAKSSVLSDRILAGAVEADRAYSDFKEGKCPGLGVGLNKLRLQRFAGAPMEDVVVVVPDNYTDDRAWPVYVRADNRRLMARSRYRVRSKLIDVWWHTVADERIDWRSYDVLMGVLDEKLHIDWDRIYVTGECRDGLAAMSLALMRPDHWAECSSSLTSTYLPLAGNAQNLNMIFVKGGHNEEWEVGYYNLAAKCFDYFGCSNVALSQTQTIEQVRGAKVPSATRSRRPARVSFSIESLANPRAFWVRIDGREDENAIGRIEAKVQGQTVHVTTMNVDAYRLFLAESPVDLTRDVEIVENGVPLGRAEEEIYSRRSAKYRDAIRMKDERLHGPVWDVFGEAYAVIMGQGTDSIYRR